jgi:YidC/Oxa1 family membrane protein insertase
MNRIMLWMMPLMFGFFSITLPSGLSVYWVVNNIIGILLQYRLTGWGTLSKPSLSSVTSLLALRRTPQQPAEVTEKNQESSGRAKEDVKGGGAERKEAAAGDMSSQRKKGSHGKHRGKRKN